MMAEASNGDVPLPGRLVVAAARQWIGTPYRHQASSLGAGADCLGLVRGVWRFLNGAEPEQPPEYSADWSEATGREQLLSAARRHLLAFDGEAGPGDVVVLRMRDGGVAKHMGIMSTDPSTHPTLIHAYSGYGVVETRMTPTWRRRVAGVFRIPDRRN